MKKSGLLFAALIALGAATANAQIKIVDDSIPPHKTEADIPDKIYVAVEESAKFPGGDAELYKFMAMNIRYPAEAVTKNIQGRVVTQFVVEKDGSVGEVKVIRGCSPELDKEAVRVVKKLPKFIPGKMNGQPVRSWYTLPITFSMQAK